MRCLSPTDCGSRAESEEASILVHSYLQPPPYTWAKHPVDDLSQAAPVPALLHSILVPGAHRDVGFLCDNLEHVRDGNVAKPLCNGQGSGASLCTEQSLGQQQPQGSSGSCLSLPQSGEVQSRRCREALNSPC